jgi:hypothetical protein
MILIRKWLPKTVLVSGFAVLCTMPLANAAPHTNDDVKGATEITGLPFTDQIDTTAATLDPKDPECPFMSGTTVWYEFTAEADMPVAMNTFGSDFDTRICVFTKDLKTLVTTNGDTGDEEILAAVTFDAVEGETYLVMVGGEFSGSSGGNLVFSVDEGLPYHIVATLDGAFFDSKSGTATLFLTVSCLAPEMTSIFVTLQQQKGNSLVSGSTDDMHFCDEDGEQLSISVAPHSGAFKGGPATLFGGACDDSGCVDFDQMDIALKNINQAN